MYNPVYGLQPLPVHGMHQPLMQGMQPPPVHGMHQPLLYGVQAPPTLVPGYEGIGGRNN